MFYEFWCHSLLRLEGLNFFFCSVAFLKFLFCVLTAFALFPVFFFFLRNHFVLLHSVESCFMFYCHMLVSVKWPEQTRGFSEESVWQPWEMATPIHKLAILAHANLWWLICSRHACQMVESDTSLAHGRRSASQPTAQSRSASFASGPFGIGPEPVEAVLLV